MSFKMNDAVNIKFTSLQGAVKGAQVDQTTLDTVYLVEYTDNAGEDQSRYFRIEELELVAA
ncbi:MAG: hypothetical protein ACR2IJ_07865 [Fluviibacter sp.]